MARKTAKKVSRRQRKKVVSKAYKKFEALALRSLNLLALQSAVAPFLDSDDFCKDDFDPDDISRAAIVLSVAAMDSYFTDVFTELLVPYLKKKGPTKDLIDLLSVAGLNTKEALEILKLDRPYRRVRSLVEGYFEQYTTQRMDVIDKLFECYGIKELSRNAERKIGKKTLLSSIRELIRRRHRIVHEGDRNSHGKYIPVEKSDIKRRIRHVMELVSAADQILANLL